MQQMDPVISGNIISTNQSKPKSHGHFAGYTMFGLPLEWIHNHMYFFIWDVINHPCLTVDIFTGRLHCFFREESFVVAAIDHKSITIFSFVWFFKLPISFRLALGLNSCFDKLIICRQSEKGNYYLCHFINPSYAYSNSYNIVIIINQTTRFMS